MPIYARSSTHKETRISHWYNKALGKRCRVCSTLMTCGDWSFTILGYNPLPCKSFVGSFHILYQWLIDNGWEHNCTQPDIIIIEK